MKPTPLPTFVDRGWYLAVFYRESKSKQFPALLEKARLFGDFANLLDENAEVVYRNIVRDQEIEAFWPILQLLGNTVPRVEFFINGVSLPFSSLEEILLCRRKFWFDKKCPAFIQRKIKLGCGAGILFDLETPSLSGQYWFDFYQWKSGHIFIRELMPLSNYFHQSPRQVLCKLNRAEEISIYFRRLPSEINIKNELGWSLTLKNAETESPAWVRALFSQEFVAISSKLPEVEDILFLERIQEKINIRRLEGNIVGTLAKESQKFFQTLQTEKILVQMIHREDYYFRFRLVPEINGVLPPKGKILKNFNIRPSPKNTAQYQQFLTQLFPEETSF